MGCGASTPVGVQPVKSDAGASLGLKSSSVVGSAPARATQSSPAVVGRNALVQQDHSSVDVAEFDFSSGVVERMEAGMEIVEFTQGFLEKAADLSMQITEITAGGSEFLMAFGESFCAVHEVIKTVANLAVPPPGGQVVAAVIQITAMIIKGQINTRQCCELGTRVNKMLKIALENKRAMTNASAGTREALNDFLDVCGTIQEFVRDVINQGWFMKMLNWKKTEAELAEMTKDIEDVTKTLGMAAQLASLTILQDAREEQQKVQKLVDDAGGPEALLADKNKLQALIESSKGIDGVQLALSRDIFGSVSDTNGLVREMSAKLSSFAMANDEGPYKVIGHDEIKKLWKDKFGKNESVKWDTFFSVFPSQVPFLDTEEIKVLEVELKDDGQSQFKLACDLDDDDQISTSEATKAFPPGTKLVDAVKQIKKSSARKGIHNALEHVASPLVYGREPDVQALVRELTSPARVVVLVGGPGEGKFNAAASALLQLYQSDQALGGVWKCKMSGVTNRQQMFETIIGGLSKANKPFDSANGIEVTWRSKLNELSRNPSKSYFMIDDCEDIASQHMPQNGEAEAICDQFRTLLGQLLSEVPKMTLLLVTRVPLPYDDLSPSEVKLKRLTVDGGKDIVQNICPRVSAADARTIALNFGCNPQVLALIAHALKNGRMEVDEAKASSGLVSLAEESTHMEQALDRMVASVKRSLETLKPEDTRMLLKMALMLPGPFGADTLPEFLPEVKNTSASKKVIKRLVTSGLLEPSEDRYCVLHTVREAARHMAHDDKAAKEYGIRSEDLEESWRRFVEYCLELAKTDFKEYITQPKATYDRMITETRANIQQALQLHLFCEDAMDDCWRDLVEILSYLPYLGCIHDGPIVVSACDELFAKAKKKSDAAAQAICKAVASYFMPAKTHDHQKEIFPLFDKVKDLLAGSSDPKAFWCMAMALRRKGCILRDNFDVGASISTLQEAKAFAEKATSLRTDMVKLEHILCLAELAGSLDYDQRIEEGEPIAQEAVNLADSMYKTAHPVNALCLSNLGYHVKGRAEKAGREGDKAAFTRLHHEAMDLHNKALAIRLSVLGKHHLEVAMSKQQAGISMQALGRYQDAETEYKESLQLRIESLGPHDNMVANTYRNLANLYMEWGSKQAEAAQSLQRMVSVGRALKWKPDNKKLVAARADLAKVLRLLGKEDEALAVEEGRA